MELIRGLHNLDPRHRECVVSIGNFDGVHLGHQAVIEQLRARATDYKLPALVLTFEPQPQEYFAGEKRPARLTSLREKLVLLEQYGVDRVLCLRFGRVFAEMEAEDFIDAIIVKGLAVPHLVVGDDFRFGHGRRGDFAMLESAGVRAGFDVENTHTYNYDGERVSSTRIRDALAAGRLDQARKLLGRNYAISGRVAHGDKRGREWGFPTANLPLGKRSASLSGIFTVSVKGLGPAPVPGVASLGTRPMVKGRDTVLEVHLLDFDQEIYGKRISVEFLQKQRDEADFPSVAALIEQISRDKREAERFFTAAR